MMKHIRYLKYVIKHKWFVFIAGRKVGGISLWHLIIHDYTKFSRAEWIPYVNRFFSGRAGIEDKTADDEAFKAAFLHHWKHNPHHWEYWNTALAAVMMPPTYAREMVADWLGAGRGITGSWDLTDWYSKNKDRQRLHPRTRKLVEDLLKEVNYGKSI